VLCSDHNLARTEMSPIKNVAVVGASGDLGRPILEALAKSGNFSQVHKPTHDRLHALHCDTIIFSPYKSIYQV
jgi:5,10-methylene-tetrahydrofolate dehydrogenase/methenyl tetrahydrofolate cyclohydrolase